MADEYTEDSWHVVTEKNQSTFSASNGRGVTTEYALDLVHIAYPNRDDNGVIDDLTSVDLAVTCKWDGCVDMNVGVILGPEDQRDYVHICDLDDFIRQLERVRDAARAHFGDNGFWKPDAKG